MAQESGMTYRHGGKMTLADVIPAQRYGRMRQEVRKVNAETSRLRWISMGPNASIYFENWDTLWFQLHEMLFIVGRDEVQIDEELRAFSMLIPKGRELVATVSLESDDIKAHKPGHNGPQLRVSMSFDGLSVVGRPKIDAGSCTSGPGPIVQFTHFDFTPRQVSKFCTPATPVVLRIEHPAYNHAVLMAEPTRRLICRDLSALGKS